MKNAFDLKLYDIKEALDDKKVEETVCSMLQSVLLYLGIGKEKIPSIIAGCISSAKSYSSIEDYEEKTHLFLVKEGVTKMIPEKLSGRAQLIYNQIKDYLIEGPVLDLGCGDGKVGEILSKNGFDVTLTDIYEHEHIKNINLPFKLFKQGEKVPFQENSFDNTLVLTVYHHSDNPLHTLNESIRVTKQNGRILVIESVYGVNGKSLLDSEKEKIKAYLSLDNERQRRVNIFFDHFYNRVIHFSKDKDTKVNVPFNFNTPEKWKEIFESRGLVQEKVIHLGLDQPTVPEYHTLHILKVKK